jgi:hypothetical protein
MMCDFTVEIIDSIKRLKYSVIINTLYIGALLNFIGKECVFKNKPENIDNLFSKHIEIIQKAFPLSIKEEMKNLEEYIMLKNKENNDE